MTYMTSAEALVVISKFNSTITDVSEIEWEWDEAYTLVVIGIKRWECWPTGALESADEKMLKHAEAMYLLDRLAASGTVSFTSGDISKQVQGKVQVEVQKSYPLFFFGGSDASVRGENVVSMLSRITPWQLGNFFVSSYCDAQVSYADIITLSVDRTTRGNGWYYELSDNDFVET